MDCSFINNNLFAILEDNLPPVVRSEMDLHIKSCPACTRVISGFRETMGIISKDRSSEINPFMTTRILQRIESRWSPQVDRKQKEFLHILQPLVFTFTLLLAILIGFSLGKEGISNITPDTSAEQELQSLRSELFISDITDDDKTLFLNP